MYNQNRNRIRAASIALSLLLMLSLNACTNAPADTAGIHSPEDQISEPDVALQFLKDGNRRYLNAQTMERNTNADDRDALKDGQHPFAVIVTCSDSRVSPEIYFDQKLGDIFVIRNAGNIADTATLGSIEYAVEHLDVPLVVVVGHSECGAVSGAFNGGEYPKNLQAVIDNIRAVTRDSSTLSEAIHANTDSVCEQIRANHVVSESDATVLAAHYDIATGEVTFSE